MPVTKLMGFVLLKATITGSRSLARPAAGKARAADGFGFGDGHKVDICAQVFAFNLATLYHVRSVYTALSSLVAGWINVTLHDLPEQKRRRCRTMGMGPLLTTQCAEQDPLLLLQTSGDESGGKVHALLLPMHVLVRSMLLSYRII